MLETLIRVRYLELDCMTNILYKNISNFRYVFYSLKRLQT